MTPKKYSYPSQERLHSEIHNIYNHNAKSSFNRYHTSVMTTVDQYGSVSRNISGSGCRVYLFRELNIIRLINIHKINAKYEKVYYKSGVNKGKYKKSNLIRKKEWIAYVYDIPCSMFSYITQNGKFNVNQHCKNFSINKTKG